MYPLPLASPHIERGLSLFSLPLGTHTHIHAHVYIHACTLYPTQPYLTTYDGPCTRAGTHTRGGMPLAYIPTNKVCSQPCLTIQAQYSCRSGRAAGSGDFGNSIILVVAGTYGCASTMLWMSLYGLRAEGGLHIKPGLIGYANRTLEA